LLPTHLGLERDQSASGIIRALIASVFSENELAKAEMLHRYYFDMQDGHTLRDSHGLPFETDSGAIEHSKDLARRLRNDPRVPSRALSIVVLDEHGREVHRELVYPGNNSRARPIKRLSR
jgi:hypothetical protein